MNWDLGDRGSSASHPAPRGVEQLRYKWVQRNWSPGRCPPVQRLSRPLISFFCGHKRLISSQQPHCYFWHPKLWGELPGRAHTQDTFMLCVLKSTHSPSSQWKFVWSWEISWSTPHCPYLSGGGNNNNCPRRQLQGLGGLLGDATCKAQSIFFLWPHLGIKLKGTNHLKKQLFFKNRKEILLFGSVLVCLSFCNKIS